MFQVLFTVSATMALNVIENLETQAFLKKFDIFVKKYWLQNDSWFASQDGKIFWLNIN